MKVNCRASKLSIIISSILFVMAVLFQLLDIKYSNNFTGFMKDIVLGTFCSSIVTVFFYISAYKVERKRVLEQYWNECRRMIIGLNRIDYMNIDYDKNIFVKFINEQKNKLWITEYYNQVKQKIPAKEFENTNLIKRKIENDNKDLLKKISEEASEKYLEEKIEKLYNRTTEKMDKIVDQYLSYLNQSTDNLNFILGDIEFFTGKANYIKAHDLFQKIYDLRVKIQESARHFRYYKDGEGNKAVVLSEILELQSNIFRIEESEDSKVVYSEFSDIMELKLEEFRAKIIYNIEPDEIHIIPLYEFAKTKEID
jgi:hypothetical protein